ncbi:thioether cross-link-forming SCIFF peptide maturase [Clostridium estertheticum]|uniref:thioether cross-link-forming SCIFF peptide maturase n=1 Tax=Clostridium estertheticum TaxID=238834 RepID=UPI001CF2B2AF|nr:thioether cross-link-forming SCIFF peptide maturase [Clostridium estertheticum]MCB2305123.1 thioether cross-link-forming SCIFF peptide maturase [Clostridium estertheticum]MCB2343607.1 thioether cross-link-forming SCIFF peptide maturase [Clostridium estertheticum]MCB2348527.1 thioether cross-link-forming SCIFF peptide maturase [Clostridium estertheticum]WAG47471.1 thioether cross-link-forming SCIFF peptide maturase [Clostridium estertheticum]
MNDIHKFKCNDDCFMLDVSSGTIHVVDKIIYEIVNENNIESRSNVINKYRGKYDKNILNECYDEIEELIKKDQLYSEDKYEYIAKNFEKEPNYIKAVCLNIAHDCNLRCKYCFADGEGYDQQRILMSFDVAKRSIDFLIKNSGTRVNIEVDFFGGEPLLNMDVVKRTVDYARSKEKQYNKNFRFTITTNAILLTEDIMDYLDENMVNVVLSIDGRKEVEDSIRIKINGGGTYDDILPKIKSMVERRVKSKKQYYIRGTFTSQNLDFSKDIKHFIDLGFKEISIEPVVLSADNPLSIKKEYLEQIYEQYDIIFKELLKHDDVIFYHFNININGGACIYKRISGCGAGFEYIAVTPEGDIYPCHQFVGNKVFYMGNVYDGIKNKEMSTDFRKSNIYNKPECKKCWARFYCSGGCQANNYNSTGDTLMPYEIGCNMQRRRIEYAIALQYYRSNKILS